MAQSNRIRGQETQFRVTRNGVLETTLTAVKSFSIVFNMAQLTEGYAGETSDRHDDIYKGVTGNFLFHPESQDALTLADLIVQRAKRRTAQAAAIISVVSVLNFPNGNRPRLSIADLKFGDIPLNMEGREAYVGMTMSWSADDYKLSTT
jgi:hypothetical protein